MKVFTKFVPIFFVALLSSCGTDDGTSSGSQCPIDAQTPTGWALKENYAIGPGLTANMVFLSPSPYNGFTANIIILSGSESGVSMESGASMEIAALEGDANVSNILVDSSRYTILDGVSSYMFQVRYTRDGRDLVGREHLFVYGGTDNQVIFTRVESDLAALSAFQEFERTLQIQ